MTELRVWCVTANHGDYGMDILHSRIATDKMEAIQDCLDEVIRRVKTEEKERLTKDTDEIVNMLMNDNQYLQNETGLRMVAEMHALNVDMSFRKRIKTTNNKNKK